LGRLSFEELIELGGYSLWWVSLIGVVEIHVPGLYRDLEMEVQAGDFWGGPRERINWIRGYILTRWSVDKGSNFGLGGTS
jgi:hypothetical protein